MATQYWAQVFAVNGIRRSFPKVQAPTSTSIEAYPMAGQWTTIVQLVGGNANVGRVGFDHGLDACVNCDPATRAVSHGMMAATVEAVLGAVHLDGGDEALTAVMEQLGLTHELLLQAVMFIAFLSLSSVWYTYPLTCLLVWFLLHGHPRVAPAPAPWYALEGGPTLPREGAAIP